ncbi:SsrA-binding protein SmpB [uncultured Paludibaculum sp.]|uniref:SsrA-binding protein SmpB n=1 Tax=uncultured Paludibaculum sp. TaxID=1765020 RepID=UPI002AAB4EBE|nr:SsrA-binding protein SmpB [uncultured Paludibaculum sp.]
MAADKTGIKLVSENRRAYHDFFILEKLEAGLVLTGTEIKSAREGKVQLRDSYADIVNGEAWILNAHFSPYSHGNIWNHDPTKKRKLLLHKQEIVKLFAKIREKGLAVIPLKLYLKNGLLKCEIGVCKGKKLHDKREAQQTRDQEMEAKQAMNVKNSRSY